MEYFWYITGDIPKGLGFKHFETNYMFLRKTDGIVPLVLFEDLCGSHLVAFPVIAVVVIAVMYLPFEIYYYVRRKKATVTEKQ